ncbi:hypothetical protein PXH59_00885 [Xenorhabdus sp. SF857]|uniref:hypothetical protein n=1 Tax=Xenorhabdus bakwenae TaxID=3026967 RepID=UPI002558202D|nr:hypothetical protein [Xenorhabdus sp. SF857]WFQ79803.1 hypothetical protein PXH59_00885 [Xenorhabdus sp. SF857]
MIDWNLFINALGAAESSKEFSELCLAIEEQAQVSQDPLEYNDPEGPTTNYSFIRSGIEVGFIQAQVSQDPLEYNDPEGPTTNYSFIRSGIEVGFIQSNCLERDFMALSDDTNYSILHFF